MITALDHVVLVCPDMDAGLAKYTALFGRGPDWESHDEAGGSATAQFRTQNCALELMAPAGDGPVSERLREILGQGGPRLTSLAFAADRIDEDHHIFTRRGLAPGEISDGQMRHAGSGEVRTWRRFRCSDAACAGIKTFILGQGPLAPPPEAPVGGGVTRLDHLVISTPNPDRAAALYGARLGLRLALDRTAEQWNTRFLFFRVGGLTLEVVHRLDEDHDPASDDTIWGLTWAVDDLDSAHARLSASGVAVSETRTGRKPGTRVFTAKSHTLGIPTLFIAHEPR